MPTLNVDIDPDLPQFPGKTSVSITGSGFTNRKIVDVACGDGSPVVGRLVVGNKFVAVVHGYAPGSYTATAKYRGTAAIVASATVAVP